MNLRTHSLMVASMAVLALGVALSLEALGQGDQGKQKAQEMKTKYGLGATHPLKGPLAGDDPLSNDPPGVRANDKPKPEPQRKKPDKDNLPDSKQSTTEDEYDQLSKQSKKGVAGVDRGPKKDKDEKVGTKGFNQETQREPQTAPDKHSVLLASLEPSLGIGGEAFEGIAANDSFGIFQAMQIACESDSSLSTNLERLYGSVIGSDDRVRITATTYYPWRAICKLRMRFPNGAQYIGSGVMIAAKYCLTAGHCVYSSGDGGWASWIEVIPGYNNGTKPFGSAWATYYRSYTGWTQSGSGDHDFALITLDRNIGSTVGWFGYGYWPWPQLTGVGSHTAGYPGDRDSGLNMYYVNGNVGGETGYQTWYWMDTAGGQSGSGVYRIIDGNRYVHTVHAWGGGVVNGGTKINSSKFNSLSSWIASGS